MTDRLPPYDQEAEMAVIGCCLLSPAECLPECQLVIFTPEYFYDIRCRTVWEKIIGMTVSNVNVITVRGDGITIEFLNECEQLVPSAANLASWLSLVEERFIARQIIKTCTLAISEAYKSNLALDFVEREVLKIRPRIKNSFSIQQLLNQATDIIEAKSQNWDLITGLSTGLSDLDQKTDGLHGGEFIVIGAPTSCGKTALALNIIVHNALSGVPSGFLSAEMLPAKLVVRSLCSEARVNFRKICSDDVPNLTAATRRISSSPIHIDNVNGFTIGQVAAYARRMKQKHDIKILAVENIQLLTGSGDNREQEIASISRGLKAISLELNIAVLGLSQLNDDGRLRESRAIGHDADSCWIIENDGVWQPKIQPVNLTVQKSRDGETGVVKLVFRKEFTRFECAARISSDDVPNNPHND